VFNSGVPIRMVGLNITRRTAFNQTDIVAMKASARKVASVVEDLMAFYLAVSENCTASTWRSFMTYARWRPMSMQCDLNIYTRAWISSGVSGHQDIRCLPDFGI
jgi:hypothetical protein